MPLSFTHKSSNTDTMIDKPQINEGPISAKRNPIRYRCGEGCGCGPVEFEMSFMKSGGPRICGSAEARSDEKGSALLATTR